MDVKTFVLFALIFSLIMVEATKVQIQATGVSDDGEGLSLADHQPLLTLHGPHHIAGKDDGKLIGTDEVPAVVPDSGDLVIPVVAESPLAAADIENKQVQLGRRILVAAVESNSSAAPGY
ncbi:PREDICTED: uncharacterized protein LOC109193912 isoform X1 [Ipomoea nil]|uniref:uncharacterized protein LOC109193912 isoform X1 n=1 Tax=Ipomoea nil TaxID=35883 RepID=UPI000900D562|nr:PREDICTED: uncharacterized protein LOC109193912 isoform X1 [Ipomoea nil]